MPALALAEALPDFGAGLGTTRAPEEPRAADIAEFPVLDFEDENPLDAAVAAAEAALRERLEQEHSDALAQERERYEKALEAAKIAMAGELGTKVSDRLDEMEARLTTLTTTLVARVLSAALTDDLQRRAIDELARIIGSALAEQDAVRIEVEGDAALFGALAEALGERGRQLQFSETGRPDLTVTVDETLIETRLAEWSGALAEVLG